MSIELLIIIIILIGWIWSGQRWKGRFISQEKALDQLIEVYKELKIKKLE